MTSTPTSDAIAAGTLLDQRYTIHRVIGIGGFGITYEASNILTGQRVAIKEWKAGDKEGFLREARMLHDFAGEEAVVSVLDYFEENNTAFLVMEYLDGVTLREYVEQKGKMTAEEAVRLFAPVFEALERIHAAGIIHRDISPDNLMVLEQAPEDADDNNRGVRREPDEAGAAGANHRAPQNDPDAPDATRKTRQICLKLMDFGAAKSYEGANVTHSVIYKPSYSPPEQMDPEGVMGSYTDVYALCGTIYYCITGKVPEDVVSRLLFDELEPPSKAGAQILPAAEDILMRGLALDYRDRVQTVDTLAKTLTLLYPDLSEAEKEAALLKRKKLRQRIAAGIAAAVVVVAILAFWNRVRIRFLLEDTVTATISGNEMNEGEFAENASLVRERADVFSQGWYLWKELPEERKIVLTLPTKLFHRTDPQNYIRMALTRPLVLSVLTDQEDGVGWKSFGVFDKQREIRDVWETEDYLYVQFTEEAAARFEGLLDKEDERVYLSFDRERIKDGSLSEGLTFDFYTTGDGSSIRGELVDENDTTIEFYVPQRLIKTQLTQRTFDKIFSVYTNFSVRWEDPASAMMPGRMQVTEDKVPGRTVLFRYPVPEVAASRSTGDSGSEASGQNGALGQNWASGQNGTLGQNWASGQNGERWQQYNSALISLQIILKNRLDAMNIPYAAGMDVYNTSALVFKVPLDQIWYLEACYLSQSIQYELDAGNSWAIYPGTLKYGIDSFYTEENTDGSFRLVTVIEDYYLPNWKEFAAVVRDQGSELTLYFDGFPIASCSPDDALASLEEDGTVSFVKWELPGVEEMNAGTRHFAGFLEASLQQSPQQAAYPTSIDMEFREQQAIGKLNSSYMRELLLDYLPEDQGALLDRWTERYDDGNVQFDYYLNSLYSYQINLFNCDLMDPERCMAILRDIQEKDADALENLKLRKLSVSFSDCPPGETSTNNINMLMSLDFMSRELKATSLSVYGDETRKAELEELWKIE